jgi:putative sigma-54 modulation protein
MNVSISFKHIDPSDSLKAFIEEKSEILNKYFDGRVHVTWNLDSVKQNRIAHCHLVGNNMDFFGEASTEDFRASIDFALDKIEKQIRKRKEIVKNHLHGHETAPRESET